MCRRCGKKFHPHPLDPANEYGRIAFLDIEATQLSGTFGVTLSWALKYEDSDEVLSDCVKSVTLSSEKKLLGSLLKAVKDADTFVTYYGTRFDIPFLRTRCMIHGLRFPSYLELFHLDLYYTVRNSFKLHSNRLSSIAELLEIEGKTDVSPRTWMRASTGDKEALKEILQHNIGDVLVLEKVYRKLQSLIRPVGRSV